MGVLSDKIQSFIDAVTNATTAVNDDVVAGKKYWSAGVVHSGTLLPIDETAYSIAIAPNGEDVAITFSRKAYTIPTDTITVPKSLVAELFPEPEVPDEPETPTEPTEPDTPEEPEVPEEPVEPEEEPDEPEEPEE